MSDEQTVARWVENPYWQYFCGMEYFQHEVPFHLMSFVKWRKPLGEKGCEELLKEVIQAGIETEVIRPKYIQKVMVDTIVQENFITHPTDAELKHRARILLLKEAKKQGLKRRQTYVRLGKQAFFLGNRYAATQQMKRAKKQWKLVSRYLGCVGRDIQR